MNKPFDLSDIDWPRDIMLVGGFECKLTSKQQNQFHEFLNKNPKFNESANLAIDIRATELALQGGNQSLFEKLKSLYKQQDHLFEELFAISKKWYEDNIISHKDKESEVNPKAQAQ